MKPQQPPVSATGAALGADLGAKVGGSDRFTEWLSDQQQSGEELTDEQMQWLVAIQDPLPAA